MIHDTIEYMLNKQVRKLTKSKFVMTRRQQLKLLGAMALTVAQGRLTPASADEPYSSSLRTVANARGLQYGAAAEARLDQVPKEYVDLFPKHCNLFAPGMGWSQVSPEPNFQNFEPDPNVAFARAQRLSFTGAHLLWHYLTPQWFSALPDRVSAERAMTAYISSTVSHYAGQVYSWNVVNEAIEPRDGRPDGLRNSVLVQKLGANFFDLAFRTARAADPSALLVYNDYNLENDTLSQLARRSALLHLLDRLQRQATPIDAVGLQSHLAIRDFQFNEKIYRDFLHDIASRGLKILITELDVFDIGAPSAIALRDQAVADLYRRLLSVALNEPAVVAVITWGLSDRYTWINLWDKKYFKRTDGLPQRPLPFDDMFQPKPAYAALQTAFENAPSRPGWQLGRGQK
jgi:endo-1,4-beta-xylanase